jgi:formamidopyrimidine-DNA glycosylase
MPELPEIEVLRRDLEKEIVGRRFKGVEVRPGANAMKIIPRHGKRKEFQDLLEGAKVESVGRRGTTIVLDLDNGCALMIDLGRAGQLKKTSSSDGMEPNTHIVFGFTIGGQLRLIDRDKGAEAYIAPSGEVDEAQAQRTKVIDPLEHPVAWQTFSQMLEDKKTEMKQLLKDDSFIVGLGDIYSDEILFTAGLRHDRRSDQLSSQDVRRLYRALMEVLQDALKARGTSYGEAPFTDLHGDPGQYQLELKVYEREGESCRRCRTAILREETDSYVTYLCPQCQL